MSKSKAKKVLSYILRQFAQDLEEGIKTDEYVVHRLEEILYDFKKK